MVKKYLYYLYRRLYANETLLVYSKRKGNSLTKRNSDIILLTTVNELESVFCTSVIFRVIKEELSRGSLAYCYIYQGEVVHYSFLANNEIKVYTSEILGNISFSKSLYIYNCYTNEKHRGKGIFKSILNYIINNCPGDESFISIAATKDNISSNSVIRSLGFNLNKTINLRSRFGVKIFNVIHHSEEVPICLSK